MKKLNPEIKQKVSELFSLIKEEEQRHGSDETAEMMKEEIGSYLKERSGGFSLLLYTYDLAQTQSEKASRDLEESTWRMTDQALGSLYDLAHSAKNMVGILEADEIDPIHLELCKKKLEEYYPIVLSRTRVEFRYRTERYGKEIEKLKAS